MNFNSTSQSPAEQRETELSDLRQRFAFESSPGSSLALAKGLWQCGRYDEAFDQFVHTRGLAPQAPDVSIALIRSAIMLSRLDDARAALDHALAIDPVLSLLVLHQAQLVATQSPAAARDLLAAHRNDPLCHLFHDALDDIAHGREAQARTLGDTGADAMWAGHVWLSQQRPHPRIMGTPTEVLRMAVNEARLDGLVMECGVYFGRSLALLAQWANQHCHGFDSFEGLPERWNEREGVGSYSTAGILPNLGGDVELHAGWFDDTLPPFFAAQQRPIRLLHIDCDLYSSTMSILRNAKPWLRAGSVIVFDDFIGYPGSEQHEFRAFHEFAQENHLSWTCLSGGLISREVALRLS